MEYIMKQEAVKCEQKERIAVVESSKSQEKQETTSTASFPLTAEQATLTTFPPGCTVIHVTSTATPPVAIMGVVQSVSFDVASRDLLYRVCSTQPNNRIQRSFIASEGQLLFAPLCPVVATVTDGTGTTKRDAIVLTSYQHLSSSGPLYSLQEDTLAGSLLHGIQASYIKYRSLETADRPDAPVLLEPSPPAHQDSSQSTTPDNDALAHAPFVANTGSRVGKRPSHSGRGVKVSANGDVNLPLMAPEAIEIYQPSSKRAKLLDESGRAQPRNASVDHDGHDGCSTGREDAPPDNDPASPTEPLQNNQPSCSHVNPPEPPVSVIDASQDGEVQQRDEDAVFETHFYIPGRVFDLDSTKEFFNLHTASLAFETQCQLRLEVRDERDKTRMVVVLKGKRSLEENALCLLEESLLGLLKPYDHGRALYYMARMNEHRFLRDYSGREIVYQYCYHFRKQRMHYMFCKRLPDDHSEILGAVIGTKWKRLKQLMTDARCDIELNHTESRCPHYVIYGDDVDTVGACSQKLDQKLKEARGRLRRTRSKLARRHSR